MTTKHITSVNIRKYHIETEFLNVVRRTIDDRGTDPLKSKAVVILQYQGPTTFM